MYEKKRHGRMSVANEHKNEFPLYAMPTAERKRLLEMPWRTRDAALGADSKIRRILSVLASGKSLNRFQALGYSDSVLNSTISKIEDKGICVSRREETVRGFEGNPVRCCRYWLEPDQRERAQKLLDGQAHQPKHSERVTAHVASQSHIDAAEEARLYRIASGR